MLDYCIVCYGTSNRRLDRLRHRPHLRDRKIEERESVGSQKRAHNGQTEHNNYALICDPGQANTITYGILRCRTRRLPYFLGHVAPSFFARDFSRTPHTEGTVTTRALGKSLALLNGAS
eukprot:sb/3476324/